MASLISRRGFLGMTAITVASAAATGTVHGRPTSPALGSVVRVAVHPAVGIARVGNSPDAFFFAPEVPGAVLTGPFKDAAGAIAKQAARFRIYGYDRDGNVVGEITASDAEISWSITAGNAKAAWYGADAPLDLPQAAPTELRNASVQDRASLAVLSRTVRVRGAGAAPQQLTGGRFLGKRVDLGEVFTDKSGRLIVMPGDGSAVSSTGAPPLAGFADNDGWTDTTADGPIHAVVRIGNRVLKAEPARVLCASPNYAPGIASSITTLYDVVYSTLVEAGRFRRPRTDFHRDVAPIFDRMTDMQWVNSGYLTTNGFGSLRDWTSPDWRARLADGSKSNARIRSAILAMFRDPFFATVQPALEPQEYGDMVGFPVDRTEPRQWLAISPVQHAHLRSWADGNFTVNAPVTPETLAEVTLNQQPAMLDRAALDGCLGGAFHPGVEFPWIARVPWIWTDDMRLMSSSKTPNLGPFGAELTPAMATSRSGPLKRIGPGDIIKWMGVPWQADSASCRYGYQETVSAVLPGFWPARIPNSILTSEDYSIVVDSSRSLDDRRAAFKRREQWERYISTPDRINVLSLMVQEWPKLGMIRERPGPSDGRFPARLQVESRLGFSGEAPDAPVWANRTTLSRYPILVTNSDDNLIRSVDASGQVTELRSIAPISRPEGIDSDAMGNVYITAMDSGQLVRVTPDGRSTVLASGLNQPLGVTCDGWGNVYVGGGASGGGWVGVVDSDGDFTQLISNTAGAIAVHALAIAPDGSLLIADNVAGRIMRYDPLLRDMLEPNWITGLSRPKNMAWDLEGNMYVVQRGINMVSKFNPDGSALPFALRGVALDGPFGIGFDGQSALFVSSAGPRANRIDRIDLQGDSGVVTTFATGMANPGGLTFQGSVTPVPLA